MAKNSIKDYFSICPIVQDQTREPNEEPEDLCKLKFCLCYCRITMLRVPDNLNIKTSYNQNINEAMYALLFFVVCNIYGCERTRTECSALTA